MSAESNMPKVTEDAVRKGLELARSRYPVTPEGMETADINPLGKESYRLCYHVLKSAGDLPDISYESFSRASFEVHTGVKWGDIDTLRLMRDDMGRSDFDRMVEEGIDRYFSRVFSPRLEGENPLYLELMHSMADRPGIAKDEVEKSACRNVISSAMVVYRAFELEESYRYN